VRRWLHNEKSAASSLHLHTMIGSSLLPRRLRGTPAADTAATPIWLNKRVTPLLQAISRPACLHPIHTIVIVALLASTTYMSLLDSSLFNSVKSSATGKADWPSLLEGSRQLRVGADTDWKWQAYDTESAITRDEDHLALLTTKSYGHNFTINFESVVRNFPGHYDSICGSVQAGPGISCSCSGNP
jgi:hypothetical protein